MDLDCSCHLSKMQPNASEKVASEPGLARASGQLDLNRAVPLELLQHEARA